MSCIFEVEIDEIISIQSPQLVMLPTVYLKDEVEPEQVPIIFIDLLHAAVHVTTHIVIGYLWSFTYYQEMLDPEKHKLLVEQSDKTLPCTTPSATFVFVYNGNGHT